MDVFHHPDAACLRRGDPDDWFPEKGEPGMDALQACWNDCPVQQECLSWAVEHNPEFGIWGGATAGTVGRLHNRRDQQQAVDQYLASPPFEPPADVPLHGASGYLAGCRCRICSRARKVAETRAGGKAA